MTDAKAPPAPRHLSARSKALWRRIHSDYGLEEHHGALLRLALEALDRADEARKLVDRDGPVTTGRYGQTVAHPAVAVEHDAAGRAARLIAQLGLDVEQPKDRRVPYGPGVR